MKLRAGVIGLSFGRHHARIYSEMPNVELVAVSDIDISKQSIAEQYNTSFQSDYRELLNLNLDLVNVVVPTRKHHEVAKRFIHAGVNCFIEKPIAYTLEQANELITLAHDNNIKLAIGHIETFNPAVVKLKNVINEGILGDIKYISSRRVGPFVDRVLDIGIMMDSATHDVGVIRYLLEKDPEDIYSKYWNIKNPKGDYAVILLDFGDMSSCIEVNWFTPYSVRTLDITGTKGCSHLDFEKQSVNITTDNYKMELNIIKQEPLLIELTHFVDCIVNNKIPIISGNEGYKILQIVLKAGAK